MDRLLDEAAALWSNDAWDRFDNDETNCTIKLYAWAEQCLKRIPELRILSLQIESVQPTPAMLAGEESAKAMTRPDIRVRIGQEGDLIVECKRLSSSQSHPRKYVREGMMRFIQGEYGRGRTFGAMVGYILADKPDDVFTAINKQVEKHPDLTAADRLNPVPPSTNIPHRYSSTHKRTDQGPIRLTHYHFDLAAKV